MDRPNGPHPAVHPGLAGVADQPVQDLDRPFGDLACLVLVYDGAGCCALEESERDSPMRNVVLG